LGSRDAGLAPCPAGAKYPTPNGTVVLKPLPRDLPTMPNPCAGVPANPWCPGAPAQHADGANGQQVPPPVGAIGTQDGGPLAPSARLRRATTASGFLPARVYHRGAHPVAAAGLHVLSR